MMVDMASMKTLYLLQLHYTFMLHSSPDGCLLGDIRLVGGQHSGEGRLEYCSGGVWGTVCNEEWDFNDALVACGQLNLNNTLDGKV